MRPSSLTRRARLALAGAVVAALCVPAAALGQPPTPTLRPGPDNGSPDRQYYLQLPAAQTLETGDVRVTENGGPISGVVGVEAPGSGTSGVVLLIDASQSMAGEPIQKAMAAARAFMKARTPQMPVAVMVYNPEQHVLTDFTTDEAVLNQAVATT